VGDTIPFAGHGAGGARGNSVVRYLLGGAAVAVRGTKLPGV
jgi:hypothetical protein